MRIALGLEYDGSKYYGWQRQREVDTVQARLEKALSTVANEPIELQCAGRTDAGVHATNQVIHFETNAVRPLKAWTMGINANLPADIAIKWAKEVDADFHARFSATARKYRYVISNKPLRPGIMQSGVTHHYESLDAELMHECAQVLIGEQDFTSFRAAQCQSNSAFRNVHHVQVTRHGDYLVVEISANAFLHHMVRNIVGSLLEVGSGNKDAAWFKSVLEAKNRDLAAPTAKPNGLYLVSVTYPAQFELPKMATGPLFFPENLYAYQFQPGN
ncbi:tRNA pseudouridine(38-40) synthase TruA [Paraferrimonas sp. SM1919]|uniref:tRNA pseudouridine(38-40) synthase TruA n=1 Tax=Paraferrimonas sp. SM1919 TaxID=2662263 RepID=UPI0013D5CF2F|nr:tRNA pseudouridine(38-40) synthase TruA [Paraferrimonas sp. SM1919]